MATTTIPEAPMSTERFDRTATTTCGYCGVGCRLEAHALDGRIVSIRPALDGPANEGHTCLKGRFAHSSPARRDRLTHAADPRATASSASPAGRRRCTASSPS